MASECFLMRKLLWDELKLRVRPSEEEELRATIGNYLIAENEELRRELATLADILTEFQQQNDNIRDALTKRQPVPEPPGRPLLLEKLKLLASDLQQQSPRESIRTPKEREILAYVWSASEDKRASSRGAQSLDRVPRTPRMVDLHLSSTESLGGSVIPIRPGTGGGARRPLTSGSQRPVSRGSTLSASSVSSLLESPELHEHLTVERIDSIKGDLQEALVEERQQLLEDIEFIQSCLEMEKDLIDEDRRTVARPPPSLSELHALGKSLERSLENHMEREKVEALLSLADQSAGGSVRRPSRTFRPESPSPLAPASPVSLPPVAAARGRRDSRPRVLKIRHAIQEARDEPFLS